MVYLELIILYISAKLNDLQKNKRRVIKHDC